MRSWVTLVPGAIELAMARMGIGHTARLRLALWRIVAAGAGFMLAHLLHFAEVVAFYGSFEAALLDLRNVAAFRSGASVAVGPLLRVAMTIVVLKHYIVGDYPISTVFWQPDAGILGNWHVCRFMGLTLGVWWLGLTTIFVLARRLPRRQPHRARAIDDDWLAVSVCGLLPCSLWYIVMLNHSIIHVHFLYRHLFLCFFLFVLFCATALAKELSRAAAWLRYVFACLLALISTAPAKTAPAGAGLECHAGRVSTRAVRRTSPPSAVVACCAPSGIHPSATSHAAKDFRRRGKDFSDLVRTFSNCAARSRSCASGARNRMACWSIGVHATA